MSMNRQGDAARHGGIEARPKRRGVGRMVRGWSGGIARRWRADVAGAAAVQFIVVLPIFIVVVFGLYGLFSVMSSRDILCESTYEAARYLQVEGPQFPDDPYYAFPDGWQREATDIINQELASRTLTDLYPVQLADVVIGSDAGKPDSPEDPVELASDWQNLVPRSMFWIKVTKSIANPLGMMLGTDPGLGQIKLTCTSTGFWEGPPIGPTNPADAGPGRCPEPVNRCDPCPGCTATVVGRNTPTICPDCLH